MTDPCRDWRGALGAAALGEIDPTEEIALRAHLDGCPACRAELRELKAVARALAAVPVENIVSAPAAPPAALAERVLDRVARERGARRSRRTRRIAAGVAAFAAAAAAVVAVVLVAGGASAPGTRVEIPGIGGAKATATLRAEKVGTEIDMKTAGLRPGHYYWLWLTGDHDDRVGAGTFSGTRDEAEMRLTVALPLSEAKRIWVTDEDKRVVLDAQLPDPA